MHDSLFIGTTAYFLALINPASKIFVLSTIEPPFRWKQLFGVALRSTAVAFLILALLTTVGDAMLRVVFHVEIYSLQVAGGIILFIIGLVAVRKGRFYEETALQKVSDISVVPLAAPLIAGPGTITAAISLSSTQGVSITLLCVSAALAINFLLMLTSLQLGHALEKINATGPLIRITGLIVTAVAAQMFFSGLSTWLHLTMES